MSPDNSAAHMDACHMLPRNRLRFSFPDSHTHRSSHVQIHLSNGTDTLLPWVPALPELFSLHLQKKNVLRCSLSWVYRDHTYAIHQDPAVFYVFSHTDASAADAHAPHGSDCHRQTPEYGFHPVPPPGLIHIFSLSQRILPASRSHDTLLPEYCGISHKLRTMPQMHPFSPSDPYSATEK